MNFGYYRLTAMVKNTNNRKTDVAHSQKLHEICNVFFAFFINKGKMKVKVCLFQWFPPCGARNSSGTYHQFIHNVSGVCLGIPR